MSWIKSNADKFVLALLALALIGVSGLFIMKTQSFSEAFADVTNPVSPNNTIPPLELDVITNAQKAHKEPVRWMVLDQTKEGSLFVGYKRLPDLSRPLPSGNQIHPPVPNGWLLKHKLNLLSPTVLSEDPDGDGFTNLDEWLGTHRPTPPPQYDEKSFDTDSSTNPLDKDSHPPYHVKLWLAKWHTVPFRLRFDAYDDTVGDQKEWSFQINTIDRGRKTEFLKLGDTVPGTVFKLEKFDKKIEKTADGIDTDVSALTLKNTETGETIVLVLTKVTDSPDSYALFEQRWPEPEVYKFAVKKLKSFGLKPNEKKEDYKLIDIDKTGAQIALPNGEKYTVPYSTAQPNQ